MPRFTEAQIKAACQLSDNQIRERVSPVLANPSEHQMAIFRFFLAELEKYLSGQDNVLSLLVKAVAGSGKTTTIVALAYLIPKYLNVIFLAFNKAIADELGNRLPQHVESKTLNSLGWGICKRFADAQAGRKIAFKDFTNGYKLNKLQREMWDFNTNKEYGADVRWLASMCQSLGIVPQELVDAEVAVPANGLKDDDATFDNILSHYDRRVPVYARAKVYEMTRQLLTKSIGITEQISFDEQKYFPVVLRDGGKRLAPWKKYDIVIIDEVQDVNAVDIELIKLVLKKGGMVLGVGDNRQSIYGFRGADTMAVEKFKAAFNAEELPLTVTYRCARTIVEAARMIFPEIEAAPGAAEGNIETIGEFGADLFQPQGDDMVICRNNAPIVGFAYKLIAARVPVFVKGRDIGRGLIAIIDKLEATDVADLASKMNMWQAQQVQIALDNNPDDEAAIQSIGDKHESIMVFVRHNADNRIDSIKKEIEELFSVRTKESDDERLMNGKVVLSTIHKAKGLEADRVFFLDSFLMFPRWITPDTWAEEQERNLQYVATTRPKTSLIYITSKGMK